tara:strand:- start:446 stop:613 length:168 start_codon:yes stop_codon:yes gene_type:complete
MKLNKHITIAQETKPFLAMMKGARREVGIVNLSVPTAVYVATFYYNSHTEFLTLL